MKYIYRNNIKWETAKVTAVNRIRHYKRLKVLVEGINGNKIVNVAYISINKYTQYVGNNGIVDNAEELLLSSLKCFINPRELSLLYSHLLSTYKCLDLMSKNRRMKEKAYFVDSSSPLGSYCFVFVERGKSIAKREKFQLVSPFSSIVGKLTLIFGHNFSTNN